MQAASGMSPWQPPPSIARLCSEVLMSHTPSSRKEAAGIGSTHYFTGKPCGRGHIANRLTSSADCVVCKSNAGKERYAANPEKYKKAALALYREQKQEISKKRKDYYLKNKERIKQNSKAFKEANPGYMKAWRKENAKKIARQTSIYRSKNREMFNERARKRRKTNPKHKSICLMRQMLHRVLSSQKAKRTEEMLGYTRKEFMLRIEETFAPGMSWSNHGEWHIDHIVPISAMLSMGISDPSKINALENLQALWAKDNLAKGARIDYRAN